MGRYIDTDAIVYTKIYKENWLEGTGEEKLAAWKKDIDAVPAADVVEVRHGRWYLEYHTWYCDRCGKNPTKGMGYVQGTDELFNYCPNCGAKMKAEQKHGFADNDTAYGGLMSAT